MIILGIARNFVEHCEETVFPVNFKIKETFLRSKIFKSFVILRAEKD